MSEEAKRGYLNYWYSLSGNLGCTKSFGLKVWMKQQETIDEQFEMLVNQAKVIMLKQQRIDYLEKTLKEFYFNCDGDTILKVQAILEKSNE